MINTEKNGKNLKICTAHQSYNLNFDSEIMKVYELNNRLFVLVGKSDLYGDRNIFCISDDGKQLWQIADPHEKIQGTCNAFTEIHFIHGDVVAGCMNGYTYSIDQETGKFKNMVFEK